MESSKQSTKYTPENPETCGFSEQYVTWHVGVDWKNSSLPQQEVVLRNTSFQSPLQSITQNPKLHSNSFETQITYQIGYGLPHCGYHGNNKFPIPLFQIARLKQLCLTNACFGFFYFTHGKLLLSSTSESSSLSSTFSLVLRRPACELDGLFTKHFQRNMAKAMQAAS